jgi:creatinine amidohydrolase
MAPRPPAEASLAALRARVEGVPEVLARTLAEPLSVPASWQGMPVVTTGIGLAEGPARWLVEVLSAAGRPARFVPLSAFAAGGATAPGALLVVFSQGLSPNASIALACRRAFAATALVTAIAPGDQDQPAGQVRELIAGGVWVFTHPGGREDGFLLRVQGPAAATLVAARLAAALGAEAAPGAEVVEATRSAARRSAAAVGDLGGWPDLAIRAALVGAAGYVAVAHGLAWKWMEGLWLQAPPLWDVLQLVHGPFQAFHGRPLVVVALEREGAPAERELFDRLARILPTHQCLMRLRATLSGPLSVLDHGAQLDHLILRLLEAAPPRDLGAWPGRGEDGPLYDLAVPLTGSGGGSPTRS